MGTMTREAKAYDIRLKRVYEPPASDDGKRILVDRLWPRGIRKEAAAVALWARDLAPSTALRRWFGHDPARWPEFQQRYAAELSLHLDLIKRVRDMARKGRVTIVYAARDELHNDAVVLRSVLLGEGLLSRE